MTKTQILAFAGIAVTVLAVQQYVTILCSEVALFERFPDIDPAVVVKVSRKMYFAALRGEYANVDTSDDAVMDAIFLSHVKTIQGQ